LPLNYPLREFAYFDRQKIVDFMSAIEDGLRQASRESIRTGNRKMSGEVGVPGLAKLDVSKGVTQREFEETRTPADASLFERLHSYLVTQKLLREVASADLAELDLVEAEVNVELSGKDFFLDFVELMRAYAPIMQQSGTALQSQAKTIIDTLTQSASNQGITLIMKPLGQTDTKLVSVLPKVKDRLRVTKEEMRGKYRILCRVLRVLKPGENIDLFDLFRGITLPREQLQKMVETQPREFSHKLTEENLTVSYPAVEVTTIALYR
jgi:hypothetical protein